MRLVFSSFIAAGLLFSAPSFAKSPEYAGLESELKQEVRPFDAKRNAMRDVDKALSKARKSGKKLIIVMGANWCHDSRALATRFTKPEFTALLESDFELLYVAAGDDPGDKSLNKDVAARFGVDKVVGTPTVFVVTSSGQVLNPDSRGYWRHSHDIPTDMTYAYFAHYAGMITAPANAPE